MNECKNCGKCCDAEHFNIRILEPDLERYVKNKQWIIIRGIEFGMDIDKKQIWKFKHKENGKCVFYDDEEKRCKIYNSRPLTCSVYPVPAEGNLTRRECRNHVLFDVSSYRNKYARFHRAYHAFDRKSITWRQEVLKRCNELANDQLEKQKHKTLKND